MKARPASRTSRTRRGVAARPAKGQPTATTFRLEPEIQKSLKELGKRTNTPVNRIVNQAVGQYLVTQVPLVEAEIEESLRRLRAYRKSDPKFEKAIARFAEAEAEFGGDDPIEGKAIAAGGPTQRLVQKLLRG